MILRLNEFSCEFSNCWVENISSNIYHKRMVSHQYDILNEFEAFYCMETVSRKYCRDMVWFQSEFCDDSSNTYCCWIASHNLRNCTVQTCFYFLGEKFENVFSNCVYSEIVSYILDNWSSFHPCASSNDFLDELSGWIVCHTHHKRMAFRHYEFSYEFSNRFYSKTL